MAASIVALLPDELTIVTELTVLEVERLAVAPPLPAGASTNTIRPGAFVSTATNFP